MGMIWNLISQNTFAPIPIVRITAFAGLETSPPAPLTANNRRGFSGVRAAIIDFPKGAIRSFLVCIPMKRPSRKSFPAWQKGTVFADVRELRMSIKTPFKEYLKEPEIIAKEFSKRCSRTSILPNVSWMNCGAL